MWQGALVTGPSDVLERLPVGEPARIASVVARYCLVEGRRGGEGGTVKKLRENEAVRDIALGLVASAVWVVASQGVGGIVDRPVLLVPTLLLVFGSSVALVRATRSERRLRRLLADLSSEPSASKAGDHFCVFAALSRATADRSLPIDVCLANCAGRTDGEGVDELRSAGFVTGDTADLVARKQDFYRSHSVPVGGAHRARLLGRLGDMAPLVLVTASDRPSVVAALGDATVVDDHFSEECRLFNVESIERVSVIGSVARRFGVDENRSCLVIDDSERDLAELRRRGYRTVGVSGLISDRSLPADLVVRDVVELSDLLDVG